ncbi:hypothetical protein [Yoonia sp. MH D7]
MKMTKHKYSKFFRSCAMSRAVCVSELCCEDLVIGGITPEEKLKMAA